MTLIDSKATTTQQHATHSNCLPMPPSPLSPFIIALYLPLEVAAAVLHGPNHVAGSRQHVGKHFEERVAGLVGVPFLRARHEVVHLQSKTTTINGGAGA